MTKYFLKESPKILMFVLQSDVFFITHLSAGSPRRDLKLFMHTNIARMDEI